MQDVVTELLERSSREVLEMKMRMNSQWLMFLNLARSLQTDDRVPYSFEKRIMARLRHSKAADLWTAWSGTMWRAAFSCILIFALTGVAVTFSDTSRAELFASDLERTVLAPVDVDDSW
jgi:hypothetical protein